MNSFDYLFRFIIVGDTNVGKTCLLSQFTDRTFKNEHEATIGVEFGSRIVNLKDKKIKIQIWDTAGQETFKSVTRSYYKGAIAAFIVFDIGDRISFENASKWLDEVRSHASDQLVLALIGNKADQEERRQISKEQAAAFAEQNGILYFETSAKRGTQVDNAFYSLSTEIIQKLESGELKSEDESRVRGHTLSAKPLPVEEPTQSSTPTSSLPPSNNRPPQSKFQPPTKSNDRCC